MKIFNTQSGRLELFTSDTGRVSVYVCGVTPYDTTHLGHAFTFLTYDVLVRYLTYLGFDVTYVQNVTDVDDDILRKAREIGTTWRELADKETAQFQNDLKMLNALPFSHYVAATAHIAEIVSNVERLVDAGVAYVVNGNAYFEVKKDPDFGKLSHLTYDKMLPIANERGNHPDDPNKRDPLDFVLWQKSGAGEPAWDSPWSAGRPGWHIECSAMATAYLGLPIDIHGGGYDLIFPHHECEIAQSEAATGTSPFVRYWMHVAMVEYQGEKMSKSLGNLVRASELLKTHSSDAIRVALLSHHYREPWEFRDSDMPDHDRTAERLRRAHRSQSGSGDAIEPEPFRNRFHTAMDNDLDTPSALRVIMDLASNIEESAGRHDVAQAQTALRELGGILGLTLA